MSRYFSRNRAPRAEYDDWYPLIPELTVSDHEPTDAGLIDLNGDTIWRAANPIGFGKDDEW